MSSEGESGKVRKYEGGKVERSSVESQNSKAVIEIKMGAFLFVPENLNSGFLISLFYFPTFVPSHLPTISRGFRRERSLVCIDCRIAYSGEQEGFASLDTSTAAAAMEFLSLVA